MEFEEIKRVRTLRERSLALQVSCTFLWVFLVLSSFYQRLSSKPFANPRLTGMTPGVDSFPHEQGLKIVHGTRKVGVVELKRHYCCGLSLSDLRGVQLPGFAHASEKAYGGVVYLRVELNTGTVLTQLVPSKPRVAPCLVCNLWVLLFNPDW